MSEKVSEGAEDGGRGGQGWSPGSLARLGDRVWLVLGGGGLRGLAHVGVWKALEESGLRVAGIVGTSIGGLVGACIAAGMHYPELVRLAFRLRRSDLARVNRRTLLFNGIRQESLFLREPLQEYLERVLPATRWEDLEIPLQVNAVDLDTGQTTWFGTDADTGPAMVDALYASAALPVFYPPARIDGRIYVDGGVEWALPLHRAAELGATGIVGVDVGSAARASSDAVEGGMLAIHQRVFSLMNWRKRAELVAHWDGPPLLFVRPRMEGYGTFAFEEVRYFIEEGYRAARAALVAGV